MKKKKLSDINLIPNIVAEFNTGSSASNILLLAPIGDPSYFSIIISISKINPTYRSAIGFLETGYKDEKKTLISSHNRIVGYIVEYMGVDYYAVKGDNYPTSVTRIIPLAVGAGFNPEVVETSRVSNVRKVT